ncbi:response regulator receiver protein [Spirillospora sp. CA-294931]|uniref:response regulator receiver protein n=1 Tax=Spirillospora sp. CA-294931 TaxID=3240042 RepID=UPI003D9209DB
MSSGVEADIVLDAAVILSLGMNRALGRTAGLAGKGAEALAALAEGRAEARAAALAEAETFDRALREVAERNARIEGLREKGLAGLPATLTPAEDQTPEELTAWCAATDEALKAAERELAERLAAEVSAQIFAAPAEGLRTETAAPAEGLRSETATAAPPLDVQETLRRVLTRLLPDATEDDRRSVAEAARLLAEASSAAEAEGVLTEVRLRVQAANKSAEEQRQEERRRAREREAVEQAEAERLYVLHSVTSAFQDLGYEVEQGFETLTANDGSVVLTKGSWPDHSVRMRVDDAAHVRAAMVRDRAAESEDDRRLDAEREREWCEEFEAARGRLKAAGIGSDVTWRLDPGVRELPVKAESRQTRPRTGRNERQREREL